MKKLALILAILSLVALLVAGCSDEYNSPTGMATTSGIAELDEIPVAGTPIEGQYIVVFKDHTVPLKSAKDQVQKIARLALTENSIDAKTLDRVYSSAITGFSAKISASEAARLAKDNRVAYVEQDQVVTICKPSNPGGDDGGDTSTEVVPWGITRVGGGVSGNFATAWVIDTGIDLDHPDLNVDASRSTYFTGKSPDDDNGHGSHCAGTIAAIDNEVGVVGVAPGATLVAVKVLDRRGSGSWSGVIAGMDYVAANAANGDVANMSLGGGISDAVDTAALNMAQAGVKVAIAAGNESQNANNCSPARVNHSNIWTVSAIDSNDGFAYFSNYANPPVDYAAPGVNIYSCNKGGGYTTMSGTSMASPHVAGLLLLGNISTDGYAIGDPDGNADPIAHN